MLGLITFREWSNEFRALWKLGWPMTVTGGVLFFTQSICLMFMGQQGKDELDATSLGNTIFLGMAFPFLQGAIYTCSNFFSQCYGSLDSRKDMGEYIQKSFLFCLLISIISSMLFLNGRAFLVGIGQDDELAKQADPFLLALIPGVLGRGWLSVLQKYMECQHRVISVMVVMSVGLVVCILLNLMLVTWLDMGPGGAGLALSLTYWFILITLITYIVCTKLYEETWAGWTRNAFTRWNVFARDYIPAVIQIFFFIMSTEIANFLAGYISKTTLAVQTILFQLDTLAWMLPIGLQMAAVTRIGHALGRSDRAQLRIIIQTSVSTIIVLGSLTALLMLILRFEIPKMFTQDAEVIRETARLLPYICLYEVLVFGALSTLGILRGALRFTEATLTSLVSYWLVSLPMGIPLMFLTPLQLEGMLIAYDVGSLLFLLLNVYFIYKINWDNVEKKVQTVFRKNASNSATDVESERQMLLGLQNVVKVKSWRKIIRSKVPVLIFLLLVVVSGILVRVLITDKLTLPKRDFNSTTVSTKDVVTLCNSLSVKLM